MFKNPFSFQGRIGRLSLLISFGVLFVSCGEKNANHAKQIVKQNSYFNLNNVEIIVERGAFHDDKFILKDTTIIYLPSEYKISNKPEYNIKSIQIISKKKKTAFANTILKLGVMNMDTLYVNNSSCNSHLIITINVGSCSKTITSYDYKRGCPFVLQYIENMMVQLHGKQLVRINLPG